MSQAIDERLEELDQQIARSEELLRKLQFQKGLLEGEKRILNITLQCEDKKVKSNK